MSSVVLLESGVVTRCRRRVHLEHDPAQRDAEQAPPDPGVEQRIADATEHRRTVADALRARFGSDWVDIPREAPSRLRERETVRAIESGARYISQALLPVDAEGGRRGGIDLLVRVGSGYLPVLIVRHKTTDPGRGARLSAVHELDPAQATRDSGRKVRSHPRDQLRLAHVVRLLQAMDACAEGPLVGGVIGVDAETVLWHDLESASWPGGHGTLTEYDRRFADRLAVATAAATESEPLAQPSRIMECRGCPWWPTCEARLREIGDVSLVVRGEDASLLRAAGVSTVEDLAELPSSAAEDVGLPQGRLADATVLAKAWLFELPLVRRAREIELERGDVEVDVDMESYGDCGAYLWGTWLSGTDVGHQPGYRGFATWEALPSDAEALSFAAFWSWFSEVRAHAHERGLTFRAYCYNELAENRWLLSSAERFAGKPGVPEVAEVRAFIESAEWIDIFAVVRDQFLCPHGRGLKVVAPSAGFGWRDPEAGGENSMRWYRDAVGMDGQEPDRQQRTRLLEYNEDDVRATWALRRWMTSPEVQDVPFIEDL